MKSALEYIDERIKNGRCGSYIMAVNPEKIMAAGKAPFLKTMFEHAGLLIPDGIGVVLGVRKVYGLRSQRVAGADLMQQICRVSAEKGYKIYVYGARERVNKNAVEILKSRFAGIQIVGRSHGYLGEDEMEDLVRAINDSGADILFVALGSPRQEQWIDTHLEKLNVKICQGIGGTLDTITGEMKRAPALFQKLGLEWFYRLVVDPKRIRRQAVLPVFMLKVLLNGRACEKAVFHKAL
jgi:N-acetylglucosaminyldiphosphoundecaprenol N-acetyl-beta-D-mannosaminyltransferase